MTLTGDYGTGKTALSKMLLLKWMRAFRRDPDSRLPIRIELGEFTRRFDFRGLLRHFGDTHGLSDVPVQALEKLLQEGRVVLILDGYDEMAQNLDLHDRRACLRALADATHGGSRGIITSCPNYFTEAEVLHVAETLYSQRKEIHRFNRPDQMTIVIDKRAALLGVLDGVVPGDLAEGLDDLM